MQNTGLLRRIGAMLYDTLLVAAVIFIATIPFIAIRGGEPVEPGNIAYQLSLAIVIYGFFVGFWARKGRTLGMQSWGLQLENAAGEIPGLAACSIRFAASILSWALLGLGFLWQLVDKEKLAMHDRISGTRLVHYPKPPKPPKPPKKSKAERKSG
jgi:uncharacterized RDD family membrane protein YckC